MSKVKWWVKDKDYISNKKVSKSPYISTTMEKILLDFSSELANNSGTKFIKLSRGRSSYIEFIFYDMERFQKSLRDHNPNEILIYDMYDLVIYGENLGSETVKEMFKRLCKTHNIWKTRHKLHELLTLDKINEILVELDDLMENYEIYSLMDEF